MQEEKVQRSSIVHQMLDSYQSACDHEALTEGIESDQRSSSVRHGKKQITDLEKKLLYLEKCMENLNVSGNQELAEVQKKQSLCFENQRKKPMKKFQYKLIVDDDQEGETTKNSQILQKKANYLHEKDKQNLAHNMVSPKRNNNKEKSIKRVINLKSDVLESAKSNKKKIHSISQNSIPSKRSKSLKRNFSKNSLASLNSKSNASQTSKQHSFRQVEHHGKDKKISFLQKQLKYFKSLYNKQNLIIQEYKIMENELKKLQVNFAKSEKVRKQQKKMLDKLAKSQA